MKLTHEAATSILKHYRGTFSLKVTRSGARRTTKNPLGISSELLPFATDRDDVYEEAISLLTDPRDTVTNVTVYSDTRNCCVLALDEDDTDRG